MHLKEYNIYVSEIPTEQTVSPQVYKCNVFAKNEIMAKGKTFSLLKRQYKIKSSQGSVLRIEEVPQYTDVKVRTFGVSAAYKLKHTYQNIHKEIRALTRVDAVFKLQQDLWSRHSARPECVTVISVKEIEDKDITSKDLLQISDSPKYPLFDKRLPATAPNFKVVPVDRA